jgi:tripartite-type tricarboxylate transporter receptor subunit TctC
MKRAALFFAAAAFCASALAQEPYPAKPLRIITPAAPGTSPDLLSRVIAQHLSPRIYQQVLVVNQPGGGGNIGHGAVAKSPPDGYTLMVTSDQLSINQTLFSKLPFHALDSFIPVVQAIVSPQVLVVSPKVDAKDVRALVEYARANPGKLNFGSPQIGTVGHLAGELLKSTQRIDIVHVPFQGATAALKEVQAGTIEMLFVTLPPAMGLIKGGSVRALAVSTPERASVIPNVPAMREFGYNEFDFGAWQGVFVPAGTPPAIVDRLNRDINSLLKDAEAIAQLTNLGFTPVGGTPEQFRKLVADGIDKWGKVVREAKIKVE